jgi:hypothetical protein
VPVFICLQGSAKRLKENRYKRWHLSMMKTEKLIKAATEKELVEVCLFGRVKEMISAVLLSCNCNVI